MTIETIKPEPAGYAGNVAPGTAWQELADNRNAQLVDVRTAAEWAYVGVPDLSALGKEVLRFEWQSYPQMQVDPGFADRVAAALSERGVDPQTPVFFICRSGARSARAAEALAAAGWRHAYNVASGFEGDRDENNHRGTVGGWKVEGLPWTQA
jgi:rhodanese-related sulfurtransferase